MATLKEVAHLAKVSESTASRILSGTTEGSARYGETTRQRVLEIAKALKYQPNLRARALAKGRSSIVAVVFPRVTDSPFSALFITQLLSAIESRCRELDYHLLISSPYLNDSGPDESYYKLLKGGYLDGIIAVDEFPRDSILTPALETHTPTVIIGFRDYPHAVRSNDQLGTALIIEHLLALGHENIGHITVPSDMHYVGLYRAKGFSDAFRSAGLDYADCPQVEGDLSIESGNRAAKLLLDNYPDITALVAWNDRMAIGALREVNARGLRIPQDLSITGYDNLPLTADLCPPLTTVDQGYELIGSLAVDHLMAVIDGKSPGLRIVEPKLITRASTGLAPKLVAI